MASWPNLADLIVGADASAPIGLLGARRWRAQVLSAYGGPTALMPFYDDTPDDAVTRLSDWLSRVHRSAKTSAT